MRRPRLNNPLLTIRAKPSGKVLVSLHLDELLLIIVVIALLVVIIRA